MPKKILETIDDIINKYKNEGDYDHASRLDSFKKDLLGNFIQEASDHRHQDIISLILKDHVDKQTPRQD